VARRSLGGEFLDDRSSRVNLPAWLIRTPIRTDFHSDRARVYCDALEAAVRPSRRPIVIATRRSRLAQAQANAVANALRKLHPKIKVQLLLVDSQGDRLVDLPLGKGTGKGMFTGAVEAALAGEQADLAVHSLKDLPTTHTPGLVIAATPQRGDVRDCLVGTDVPNVEALPDGARIGTSSPRRAAQLLRWRSDLHIEPLRGNVDTRISKVTQHDQYDAAILAVAGLQRSGLGEHASRPIDVQQMLPAPGQAALAIQCRADDHVTMRRCLPLNHSATATCVEAERQIVAELGATCHTPIATLAEPVEGSKLRVRAQLLSKDGRTSLETDRTASAKQSRKLAQKVAAELLAAGAKDLL
jgi:hydroxymethylbilane synthase